MATTLRFANKKWEQFFKEKLEKHFAPELKSAFYMVFLKGFDAGRQFGDGEEE